MYKAFIVITLSFATIITVGATIAQPSIESYQELFVSQGLGLGAYSLETGVAFGGSIEDIDRCVCSNNELVEIGSPKGGTFIKDRTTKVYDKNNFDEGKMVVGLASGQSACIKLKISITGLQCKLDKIAPVIQIVGTN